jgi:hypothetical protein
MAALPACLVGIWDLETAQQILMNVPPIMETVITTVTTPQVPISAPVMMATGWRRMDTHVPVWLVSTQETCLKDQ